MEARVEDIPDSRRPRTASQRLVSFFESQRARGVAYCRRIVGDSHVAEDIYQEGWLRLRRHARRHGELRAEPTALLFRALSNLCLNYLARRERLNVSLQDFERSAADSGRSAWLDDHKALPPDELSHRSERAQLIARAIRTLGPLPRRAFMLKEFDDLSYREIAGELGVSESNVGVLIYRARERLRELLAHALKDQE
jgi:RNA polymerase sigma-70 factor (ECF subfamily)